MEENENKQEITVDAEALKNETVDTVKQVRETMKNVNVKDEAKATKGFIIEMFKNPLQKLKEIVNDTTNNYFKTAIILVIIWMIATLISVIDFDYFSGRVLLQYIKVTLTPALMIIAMSSIIFVMNIKAKKSLQTVLSTITAIKSPVILAEVISLITLFSSSAYKITNRISNICSIISTVLMYFAIRELYNEEDEKTAFKNFVIIEVIYIVVSLVISFLEIYI